MIKEMICRACGFPLGKYRKIFDQRLRDGKKSGKEILDDLQIHRECCRGYFITCVDMTDYFK